MPWKAEDAAKHKKGLSGKESAKWARIANAILADCQGMKGSDCEGKAIRIANSRVGGKGAKAHQEGAA